MDQPKIDLNLLRILEALHEEGSVSGAARRLAVSQPTVSFGLSKLRTYFRDSLFVRSAGGVRPTVFAASLRRPVQDALGIIEREVAPKALFAPAGTTRVFTISTSDIGELCFLPLLLQAFEERAPEATLQCVSLAPDDVHRALATGDVDAACGYFPDLFQPDLERLFLFNHPFVCIAREGNPHLDEPLSRAAFFAAPHAIVRQRGRSQELVERTLRDLGLHRRIQLQSPHFVSLPMLIATTNLISVVPRAVATSSSESSRLQILQPPIDFPEIPIACHWARRARHDPGAAWLISLVGELFEGRDPTRSDAGER